VGCRIFDHQVPPDRQFPPPEDLGRFAEELRGPLVEHCAQSVVPIYEGVDGGNPVLVGTGTLFAVAEERFLVTAAHVAEDFVKNRSVLLTSNATTGRNLAHIDYDWACARDEFDVAVFRLGPEAVESLRGLTFLSVNDVELEPTTRACTSSTASREPGGSPTPRTSRSA
jgi:hypothetical protein